MAKNREQRAASKVQRLAIGLVAFFLAVSCSGIPATQTRRERAEELIQIAWDNYIDDYDAAIANYTEAIRLYPNYAEAYYFRAYVYAVKGDHDKTVADTTAAARDDDFYYAVVGEFADLYLDGEFGTNYAQALSILSGAIRAKPRLPDGYLKRGDIYARTSAYDQAIADYTAVLGIQPDHIDALKRRADAYLCKSDIDRAVADWDAVLGLDPHDAVTERNVAVAQQRRTYGLLDIPTE